MKSVRWMLLAILMIQVTSLAQERKSDSERVQIIRNCVKSFLQTLDEPTITPASDSFLGDNDEYQLVKAYFDLNHATIDSMAALKKRFPAEMEKNKDSGSLVKSLNARLEHDPVIITGDKAIVGRVKAGMTLKEVDGVWKVDSMLSDPVLRDKLVANLRATIDASQELIKELEAGKYNSAAEAQKAFASKVKAATAKSSTTKPVF